jgi:stress response protein SCP2
MDVIAIELVKRGMSVELTKTNPGLTKIIVGLSWGGKGTIQKGTDGSVGGFFKKLFAMGGDAVRSVTGNDVDIDSTIVLLDEANHVLETIYFGNKTSKNGAVVHAGDDLTGRDKKGVYDNEEITVDLSKLSANVYKVLVLTNIYAAHNRNQHYGQVDSYVRVLKADSREEIIHYDLDEDYNGCTAMIVGAFYRHHDDWKFQAIGKGTRDGSISEVTRTYLS